MRYLRIFLIYVQDVFEYRSIAVVWFLVSLINPLLYLLFWQGAIDTSHSTIFTSLDSVAEYYFLYLIMSGFLMTHIEHEVAYTDIKEGGLIKYILKPFSYFSFKFLTELSWRIVMGVLSVVSYLILTQIFGEFFVLHVTPIGWVFVIVSCLLGLFISFIFKMIIGFSALWVVEFNGIEQLVFVASLIFSGAVVPLSMSPVLLQTIAAFTPFPYIVYYPIQFLQGQLSLAQSFMLIGHQMMWVIGLIWVYKLVWRSGSKRFTGVGI